MEVGKWRSMKTLRKYSRKIERRNNWRTVVKTRRPKDAHLDPCQVWANLYLLDILSNSVTPLAVIAAATVCPLPGHHISRLNPTAHLLLTRDLRIRTLLGIGLPTRPGPTMEVLAPQVVRRALVAISPCLQGILSRYEVAPVQGQYPLTRLRRLHLSCSLGLQADHVPGCELTAAPPKPLGNLSPSQVMTKSI